MKSDIKQSEFYKRFDKYCKMKALKELFNQINIETFNWYKRMTN